MNTVENITNAILESSITSPLTITKAPPGAGKSYLVRLAAGLHGLGMEHSVAIATPTREQGLDLAAGIAQDYPSLQVVWHAPHPPVGHPELTHISTPADLPSTPHIAVGTIAKWGYYNADKHEGEYAMLVVDEAFQVTDAAFTTIAHVATHYFLVGDPGQIAPVVTADMSEWAHLPDAPTLPVPETLLYRRPETPVFELPSTRRFGAASAAMVCENFYDFSWDSIAPPMGLQVPGSPVLDSISSGAGISSLVLPADDAVPRNDPELAGAIAAVAHKVLDKGVFTVEGVVQPVGQVYVSCAHRDQVSAARAACAGLDVVVDTAERLQGRQAAFTIAWHPASGSHAVTEFQRNTGRLCVMLSRHKAGSMVVMREDTAERLGSYESPGRSVVGEDGVYRAWQTTKAMTERLLADGVRVSSVGQIR